MGRELLCTAVRIISDNNGVMMEGEFGENCCESHLDLSVIFVSY
jgi:hypothetical protein